MTDENEPTGWHCNRCNVDDFHTYYRLDRDCFNCCNDNNKTGYYLYETEDDTYKKSITFTGDFVINITGQMNLSLDKEDIIKFFKQLLENKSK